MRNTNLKELYGKEYFEKPKRKKRADYRPSLKTFENAVMKYKPKRVLDVGCGHGFLVRDLLKVGIDTIGLDFSEYAGKFFPKERFVLAEAQKLPFPDKSFDIVCSKGVLEHIPEEDMNQVCSEMERVGKHVIAEVCHKEKLSIGHITIRPLSWWRDRYPKIHFIIRGKLKEQLL